MLEARTRTLRYAGSIRTPADASGWRKNRAPYFFRILRELLGLAGGGSAEGSAAGPRRPARTASPRPPADPSAYFAGPSGAALRRSQRRVTEEDGP